MGLLELLIVLFVVFLIAGPRRLAKVFRSLGRGVRDFTTEFDRRSNSELSKRERDEEDDR